MCRIVLVKWNTITNRISLGINIVFLILILIISPLLTSVTSFHLYLSIPESPLLLSLSSSVAGLGGCIRGLSIQSDQTSPPVGQSVNLFLASRRSVRVYLDGCPTSESRYNCRGNDSVLVYSGKRTRAADYSLQPFTGNNHINTSI